MCRFRVPINEGNEMSRGTWGKGEKLKPSTCGARKISR